MFNGSLGPNEVDKLTMWQYTSLLSKWNDAHDDGSQVEAPTRDEFEAQLNYLRSLPKERMIKV